MNTNIENILIKTLEKTQTVGGDIYDATKNGIGKAVDFAQEQIPQVIQQIMLWEFWCHAIHAIIWTVIMVVILYFTIRYWKIAWKNTDDYKHGPTIVLNIIGLVISLIILGAGVIPNTQTCVKIGIAPKVFLIEYCSDLLQHKSDLEGRDHNH